MYPCTSSNLVDSWRTFVAVVAVVFFFLLMLFVLLQDDNPKKKKEKRMFWKHGNYLSGLAFIVSFGLLH